MFLSKNVCNKKEHYYQDNDPIEKDDGYIIPLIIF